MTDLINSVSRSHYELMKSYWTYIESVDQAPTVDDIPQLPSSFL
ncbi:hypothetical protein SP19_24 [Salmonella phage 19]|nr:hypothetical protein SP19_24 [Salmonella phage 19]